VFYSLIITHGKLVTVDTAHTFFSIAGGWELSYGLKKSRVTCFTGSRFNTRKHPR
jgi:hypothetical protein